MAGEQGSHIRDDTPLNTVIREDHNRHHMAVTLYENTIYRIRIQLDCDERSARASFKLSCNLAQDVNVLIDLNGDGIFDESESHVPHRWPLRSTMTIGIYDLEIPVPSINERSMRSGTHLMRVVVKSSDEYIRKCGKSDYSETREYTVNIIPKATYSGATYNDGAYPSAVHSDAAYPSAVHNDAAYPSAVHNDGAYPGAVHNDAAYNGEVFNDAAYPSAVHNDAAYPSAVHNDVAYPSAVHNDAAYPGAVHNDAAYNGGNTLF
ncbi:unnamed protein product [Rotaria sp. Silwood2]|nr:unnamed protein product [Rotaria sp. Silwood2]